MAEVSLPMLLSLIHRVLDEQAVIRRDVATIRTVLPDVVDQQRRFERRLVEMKDDIELMLKAEVMGQRSYLETQMERRMDALEARLDQGHEA